MEVWGCEDDVVAHQSPENQMSPSAVHCVSFALQPACVVTYKYTENKILSTV